MISDTQKYSSPGAVTVREQASSRPGTSGHNPSRRPLSSRGHNGGSISNLSEGVGESATSHAFRGERASVRRSDHRKLSPATSSRSKKQELVDINFLPKNKENHDYPHQHQQSARPFASNREDAKRASSGRKLRSSKNMNSTSGVQHHREWNEKSEEKHNRTKQATASCTNNSTSRDHEADAPRHLRPGPRSCVNTGRRSSHTHGKRSSSKTTGAQGQPLAAKRESRTHTPTTVKNQQAREGTRTRRKTTITPTPPSTKKKKLNKPVASSGIKECCGHCLLVFLALAAVTFVGGKIYYRYWYKNQPEAGAVTLTKNWQRPGISRKPKIGNARGPGSQSQFPPLSDALLEDHQRSQVVGGHSFFGRPRGENENNTLSTKDPVAAKAQAHALALPVARRGGGGRSSAAVGGSSREGEEGPAATAKKNPQQQEVIFYDVDGEEQFNPDPTDFAWAPDIGVSFDASGRIADRAGPVRREAGGRTGVAGSPTATGGGGAAAEPPPAPPDAAARKAGAGPPSSASGGQAAAGAGSASRGGGAVESTTGAGARRQALEELLVPPSKPDQEVSMHYVGYGLFGMPNVGNSCYLNAFLQAFWRLPPVRRHVDQICQQVVLLSERNEPRAAGVAASAPADRSAEFRNQSEDATSAIEGADEHGTATGSDAIFRETPTAAESPARGYPMLEWACNLHHTFVDAERAALNMDPLGVDTRQVAEEIYIRLESALQAFRERAATISENPMWNEHAQQDATEVLDILFSHFLHPITEPVCTFHIQQTRFQEFDRQRCKANEVDTHVVLTIPMRSGAAASAGGAAGGGPGPGHLPDDFDPHSLSQLVKAYFSVPERIKADRPISWNRFNGEDQDDYCNRAVEESAREEDPVTSTSLRSPPVVENGNAAITISTEIKISEGNSELHQSAQTIANGQVNQAFLATPVDLSNPTSSSRVSVRANQVVAAQDEEQPHSLFPQPAGLPKHQRENATGSAPGARENSSTRPAKARDVTYPFWQKLALKHPPPPVLVMRLARFGFTPAGTVKNSDEVDLEESLVLRFQEPAPPNYRSRNSNRIRNRPPGTVVNVIALERKVTYRLQSLVLHRGESPDDGHYIAMVNYGQQGLPGANATRGKTTWVMYDDFAFYRWSRTNGSEVVLSHPDIKTQCYLLFYVRQDLAVN
ncbi:unnamed protein product [Amoebophrya sp. A120]|nr:unnamed protein product [Amoebophrya sp. A120]|eukprot:GSA120T00018072001.1